MRRPCEGRIIQHANMLTRPNSEPVYPILNLTTKLVKIFKALDNKHHVPHVCNELKTSLTGTAIWRMLDVTTFQPRRDHLHRLGGGGGGVPVPTQDSHIRKLTHWSTFSPPNEDKRRDETNHASRHQLVKTFSHHSTIDTTTTNDEPTTAKV